MKLPPDRARIRTEQRHQLSSQLDALSSRECVELIVQDHRTVADAVSAAAPALTAFIDALVPRMRQGGRLVYVGAGTSGRLGVLDASECPPTFQADPGQIVGLIAGGEPALRRSSEGKEDDAQGGAQALSELKLSGHDTLLGIAAGGTTPYVLGALKLAKSIDGQVLTGLLTCAPSDPPADCDHLILLDTGPELLTGSTRLKAGSATKLALNIITTTAFIQLGKVYSNLMVDLRATNDKLTDRAIRILMTLCPDLTREAAHELLLSADRSVKPALVMHHAGIDRAAALALLERHGGRLRPILGDRLAGT